MLFDLSYRVLRIYSCNVIIMIIAIEEGLHTVTTKEQRVLSHLLFIIVFPVAVSILCIKVILIRRDEGRRNLLGKKLLPVKTFEPNMLLDFLRPVEPKAVDRLSLNEFVNKVSSFKAPA